MSYAGSNLASILDTLTAALCADGGPPVGNAIGSANDAQVATSTNSITWVPRDKQPVLARPHQQPIDATTARPLGTAIAQRHFVCDAAIYGKDFQSALDLDDRLIAALYTAFGENAADVFNAPPGELDGGGVRSGEAFCIVRPVVFAIPVYLEKFIPAQGHAAALTGQAVDPLGTHPEIVI